MVSFVHHISRYQFQCGHNSCRKDSEVFSSYLLIESVLTPPLVSKINVFNGVQIWSSCWNGKFLSFNFIPGRSGFHTVLWRITILHGKFPLCVSTFFKYARKMFRDKWEKLFRIYSTMVLFHCNYTLSIWNCCHKACNILSCASVTFFPSKTKIKS